MEAKGCAKPCVWKDARRHFYWSLRARLARTAALAQLAEADPELSLAARVRLLVTPDPPFLAEMVLTLLGQPKVTVSCTPLAKNFFDVMDVPDLSKLLSDAINSVAEMYVAPRSLTLDLKTLLSGREKMDTDAVGVLIVTVKRAHGFQNGDKVKFWQKQGDQKGDLYVTLSWSKWGKPLWSTR